MGNSVSPNAHPQMPRPYVYVYVYVYPSEEMKIVSQVREDQIQAVNMRGKRAG